MPFSFSLRISDFLRPSGFGFPPSCRPSAVLRLYTPKPTLPLPPTVLRNHSQEFGEAFRDFQGGDWAVLDGIFRACFA